jgi:branched-subunit amino acid transport protein
MVLAMVGVAVVTFITRSFFLIPDRQVPLPDWLREGLRFAPLGALVAIVVPQIVMTDGVLSASWRDPRMYAAAVAMAVYFWRRGIVSTLAAGMTVLLGLTWWWGGG